MKLLVDIGNSRIKWAFGVADRFVAQGEAFGDVEPSLGVMLESRYEPEEIRVANVAGADAGFRIAALLAERFRIKPVFAGSAAVGAGIRNGYSDPGQLGIDRWLALCGAFSRYKAPICVVDTGTATTLDLVTGDGKHKGGLILPGIELMQLALLRGTGDLARLSAGADSGLDRAFQAAGLSTSQVESRIVLGHETGAAIRFGGLQATACLARQCMDELCADRSVEAIPGVLVVTGGAALVLHAALLRQGGFQGANVRQGHRLEHRHQLVLEGLALDPPCFTTAG
ncbi:MAG: type III pantothenate kinase [Chromatiales bacterium]|jgi:pantothenate kinase type III|nr:MAG: type III pantothenate kinase [Chromatiales bacterium]